MADPVAGGTLCPSCGALISPPVGVCSRCGYDARPGAGSAPPAHATANPYAPMTGGGVFIRHPDADKPSWQETAFRIVSYLILIDGVLEIIVGIASLAKSGGSSGGTSVGHGALMTLVGVGLLAEWSFASVVLKITCWVNIVIAGCLIAGALLAMGGSLVGWVLALAAAFYLGIYGFILYLVNTVGLD